MDDALDRAEAFAILRRAGERERAHRAAVERVVERDDLLALPAARVEVPTRQLEERLVRLRARVAEERAVVAALLAELLREEDVLLVVEIVRDVGELPGLRADRGDPLGMRMTDRAHGDTSREIEPTLAVDIEELAALSTRQHHRGGLVVRVEILVRGGEKSVRRHDAARVSLPRFPKNRRPSLVTQSSVAER